MESILFENLCWIVRYCIFVSHKLSKGEQNLGDDAGIPPVL